MSFMTELVAYLDSQLAASWVAGQNLGYNGFPDEATDGTITAISLFLEPGEPADKITDIFYPYINLKSRAKTMPLAVANWDTAFAVLNRLTNQTLTNFTIGYMFSIGSSSNIERNDPNDVIIEGTFRTMFKNGTNV